MDAPSLDRWRQIDALFEAALERPPDERTAFLRAHCGGDPDLYAEVLALLEADAEAERALGECATDFAAPLLPGLRETLGLEATLPAGTRAGPWRLLGLIGQGGMGNVYLAERADGAFEKRAALKVVKRGMDTDEVLARFRRERQVLAALDHPNIARLLDGGVTEDGRPYLVMEYVEGEPLTAYADARRLGVEDRLALFARAGDAVAYAHRGLVVHRDLKPSNILVTDAGEVKLLDFGIAKLLEDADEGARTREGARLLTPAYAAPEQVRGEAVTTATDVYSLGALLYELLAGRRPHDLAGLGPLERERAVLHAEPERPSAAVTPEAAAARAAAPGRLRKRLRGDLDTVVLKALRKEPERRYPSVEALLEDLRRVRADLPVRARPETAAYRAGKFVRRHRAGVAAAAAFVLLLAGAVVALAVQQRATARERDRAERELAQKAEVTAFLTDLFGAADPSEARGDTLTAFDLLARGTERVEAELADQPAVQGHLLHILSHIYDRLGDLDRAHALARRSLEVRRAAFGERHPDVATSENQLGSVAQSLGDYETAEAHFRRALALRRDLLDPAAPEITEAVMNLGLLLSYTGAYDEGETLLREALDRDRDRHGDEHADVATDLNNLAVLLYFKGDYRGAGEALREALAIRRAVYGEPHPRVALTLNNLAAILRRTGDLAAAEPLFREALAMSRRLHGDAHPDVASTLSNLAAVVGEAGRPAEAEALLREAVAIGRTLYDEHPELADALGNLGRTLLDLGRPDEAEATLREALAMNRATRGAEHPRSALVTYHLARVAEARGDDGAAEALLRDALALQDRALPPDHDETALTCSDLGHVLTRQGRYAEAEPLLLRAHAALSATYGPDDARVREVGGRLAGLYEAWAQPERAEAYRAALTPASAPPR